MNDKGKEINELKERLSRLESSQDPLYEKLKNDERDKFKKENKTAGCLGNIIASILVLGLAAWLIDDDADETSATEAVKIDKQETKKIDRNNQYKVMMVDTLNKQGFDSYWSQDTSLWIENPGYTSPELEMLGYKLCDLSKDSGMSQRYVITFWQSLKNGPNGKIINVKCF